MADKFFSTKEACIYISEELAKRDIQFAPTSARRRIRDHREIEPIEINPQVFAYSQTSLDEWIEKFAQKPSGRGRPVGWRKYPDKKS